MAGVYVGKSKWVTNMQNYTPKKIGAWGCFKLRKKVFRQPLPCKKIAVKYFFLNFLYIF